VFEQEEIEESEKTSEDQTDDDSLKPVQYSTRKNAYPFYINEEYLEKKEMLA
jgi:hypothetical protein